MPILKKLCFLLLLSFLSGCAGVTASSISPEKYINLRRGDILTTGQLSAYTRSTLQTVGYKLERQTKLDLSDVIIRLTRANMLPQEKKLSALAEIWLQEALEQDGPDRYEEAALDAYLKTARYAYAYIFLSERHPEQRAFEERQSQLIDYYNFAVQQVAEELFALYLQQPELFTQGRARVGAWNITLNTAQDILSGQKLIELQPASSLSFSGIRNQYRRDGLGADLVASTRKNATPDELNKAELPFSTLPFISASATLDFQHSNLDSALTSHNITLSIYNPYSVHKVPLGGIEVPLSADFTSNYGLWLANSQFSAQAFDSFFGYGNALDQPHIYLMQPYDPNRRTVIMLHGLASSPEAWINVVNEILGDSYLAEHYQIWQVYYPTNAPIPFNNREIRNAIETTLKTLDPTGTAKASNDVLIVGHSMGGVLSRLLVSDSEDKLQNVLFNAPNISENDKTVVLDQTEQYLNFKHLPQVSRAIFIAAPHRGTPIASYNIILNLAFSIMKMPAKLLLTANDILERIGDQEKQKLFEEMRLLNSIASLSSDNAFTKAAANLPISPTVKYHSIIANYTPGKKLEDTTDSLVPYTSSHLSGAESELVVPSGHSVQERPEAIIEIRRIMRKHLAELGDK